MNETSVTRTAMKALLAVLAAGVLTGCPGPPPCPEKMSTLNQLVDAYNTNAGKVPRLWARAKIEVHLTSPEGVPFHWGSAADLATPNGNLLFERDPKYALGPHYFLLRMKELNQELFRLGSNVEEGKYYFWYSVGKNRQAWIGRNELAGAPGVAGLPIDPHQLISVLSVCFLPRDFTDAPTVMKTMETDPGKCAYVLTYVDRQPISKRLGPRREIYFHWGEDKPATPWWRKPRGAAPEDLLAKVKGMPFMVRFLDIHGKRIMTAYLDKYQPIEPPDPAEAETKQAAAWAKAAVASPAIMPTDIRIEWPEKKSSIRVALTEMTSQSKGNVPKATSLRYLPEGIPVRQVDAHIRVRRPAP